MKNYAKLLFVFALALVALACISTPVMAQDCDNPLNPDTCAHGGHEPIIIIVCNGGPGCGGTTGGGGASASYAVVVETADKAAREVRIPLEVILRLAGRI